MSNTTKDQWRGFNMGHYTCDEWHDLKRHYLSQAHRERSEALHGLLTTVLDRIWRTVKGRGSGLFERFALGWQHDTALPEGSADRRNSGRSSTGRA